MVDLLIDFLIEITKEFWKDHGQKFLEAIAKELGKQVVLLVKDVGGKVLIWVKNAVLGAIAKELGKRLVLLAKAMGGKVLIWMKNTTIDGFDWVKNNPALVSTCLVGGLVGVAAWYAWPFLATPPVVAAAASAIPL